MPREYLIHLLEELALIFSTKGTQRRAGSNTDTYFIANVITRKNIPIYSKTKIGWFSIIIVKNKYLLLYDITS